MKMHVNAEKPMQILLYSLYYIKIFEITLIIKNMLKKRLFILEKFFFHEAFNSNYLFDLF